MIQALFLSLGEPYFSFSSSLYSFHDQILLFGTSEVELFEQDFAIGLWMGVAAQNQGA